MELADELTSAVSQPVMTSLSSVSYYILRVPTIPKSSCNSLEFLLFLRVSNIP